MEDDERVRIRCTRGFALRHEVADELSQLRELLADGAPRHCVLADAGYGVDTAFPPRRSATWDCRMPWA